MEGGREEIDERKQWKVGVAERAREKRGEEGGIKERGGMEEEKEGLRELRRN